MDLIFMCFITLFVAISKSVLGHQTWTSCLELYRLEKSADPVCLCPMLKDYVLCLLRQSEVDHKEVEFFIAEEHKLTAGQCDCLSEVLRLLFEPKVEALNHFYRLTRVISYAVVLAAVLLLCDLMSPARLRMHSCVPLVLLFMMCLALYVLANTTASWIMSGEF